MNFIKLVIVITFLAQSFTSSSQKVLIDTNYTINPVIKTSRLVRATEDITTGQITLTYRNDQQINNQAFYSYVFDSHLNLLKSEVQTAEYDNTNNLQLLFPNYRGPSFTYEGIKVTQTNDLINARKGIRVIKYTTTYNWNWFWREYIPETLEQESKTIEKFDNEKYFLIHQFFNLGINKLYFLTGYKPNGKVLLTSPVSQRPLLKKYKFFRVNPGLEIEELDSLVFDHPMELVDIRLINGKNDRLFLGQQLNQSAPDPKSQALYIFAPAGGLYTGDKDPNKGNWLFVFINADGSIKKTKVQLPGSAWKITDVLYRNDSIYVFGPARADKYYNSLTPDAEHEISKNTLKFKGFQVLRMINGNVDYIRMFHINEFKANADQIAKKRKNRYFGKEFIFTYARIGPQGEFFIGGQRIMESTISEGGGDGQPKQTRTVRTGYRAPILMSIDKSGKLKRVFGYKRFYLFTRESGEISPMEVRFQNGKTYWEVSELYDQRTYHTTRPVYDVPVFRSVGPTITSVFNKYLVFPRIMEINPEKGLMMAPVNIGTNPKGKPRFYSDNNCPVLPLNDGSLLYIGYDANYNRLWLGKIELN